MKSTRSSLFRAIFGFAGMLLLGASVLAIPEIDAGIGMLSAIALAGAIGGWGPLL